LPARDAAHHRQGEEIVGEIVSSALIRIPRDMPDFSVSTFSSPSAAGARPQRSPSEAEMGGDFRPGRRRAVRPRVIPDELQDLLLAAGQVEGMESSIRL